MSVSAGLMFGKRYTSIDTSSLSERDVALADCISHKNILGYPLYREVSEKAFTMKSAILFAAMTLVAGTASACPWAANSYKASIEGRVDFNFTFDTDCSSILAQKAGKQAENVQLRFVEGREADTGWYFEYDLFEFLFNEDGVRADARQGGARRTMRLRQVNS